MTNLAAWQVVPVFLGVEVVDVAAVFALVAVQPVERIHFLAEESAEVSRLAEEDDYP